MVIVLAPSVGSQKSADRKNAVSTMVSEAAEHPDAPPPDTEPAKIGEDTRRKTGIKPKQFFMNK